MRRLVCLLVAIAALHAGEVKPVAYEPVDWRSAPAGPTGHTGSTELRHPVSNSLVMRYEVYAPASLPKEPTLGLIVGFHGLGGNESAAQAGYWPMKRLGLDGNYICAGGKAQGNGWALADEGRLLQFVDWLVTVYPIDRRRVFYWGHSNGGWAVGTFGQRHADRVAGVVRYSGYGDLASGGRATETPPLEWYLVHGDIDPVVKVPGSRNLRLSLLAGGYRFVYREIIGADHGNDLLWNRPVMDDAARWLDGLRHKLILPGEADVALLKGLGKAKESELDMQLADPAVWQQLVRIGGPHAWSVAAKAQKSKDARVRTALAKACATVSFSAEPAMAALTKLLGDADAGVRSAAIAALGVHANWRGLPAQTALARFAADRAGDAGERVAAATALAAVLTLPLQGNLADDAPAVAGVLALLDSEDEAVRAAAAAPLRIAAADAFGYDPAASAAARKGAVARCRTWFAERSGAANEPKTAKRR